jgi:7-cyano-7-deazaguanine synthase
MVNQSQTTTKRAVVLLSGGIDSSTTAAIAIREGYSVYALTFDYGQRHRFELESAKRIAKALGVANHKTIALDLRQIGGSALTDHIKVPKSRDLEEMGKSIPVTYVPARNMILLSVAVGWAEVVNADAIFIGANAVDYSGYPDCRPEFLEAFEIMANLGTRRGVEGSPIAVKAPLVKLRKAEIIRTGVELGVDYSLTTSCYDALPDGAACGSCDSCLLRQKGFAEAGVPDPTVYVGKGLSK